MFRFAWFRRVSTYGVAATMAGFGLTGIASAQTITNTGPDSYNAIKTEVKNNCSVKNYNNISAHSSNYQSAATGNATENDNTTAGSWSGWAGLDPASAQADGVSYDSWWNGVVTWMSQHASGSGWNSTEDNLSWQPSGAAWTGYDPVLWQQNGQSFGNWYNGTESYLNLNNPAWALGWPADATGNGNFGSGATSGNATNNNSANFSITINNAARAAAGTNSCGQSNFVPPSCNSCGGMGGGPSVSGASTVVPVGTPFHVAGTSVGGGGGFSAGPFFSAPPHFAPAVTSSPTFVPSGPSSSNVVSTPVTPSTPAVSENSISNTGPESTNVITTKVTDNSTVQNTTDISLCNTNDQSASSGNTTVSWNTSAGSGTSGDASNGNGTGVGAGVVN